MNHKSKRVRKAGLQQVIEGTKGEFAGVPTLTLRGAKAATTEFVDRLQAAVDAMVAVEKARAVLTQALAAEQKADDGIKEDLKAFKKLVEAQVGDTEAAATALAKFGWQPRKKRIKSPETKLRAAEKSLATRAARHTMGPKQKAHIKGVVPSQ